MIETLFANALMCMALNIYHEARNESTAGQLAVGQVVMNRVFDDRFPNTVCGVVTQGIHWESIPPRNQTHPCLLYTSPSPRDGLLSRMPSSA